MKLLLLFGSFGFGELFGVFLPFIVIGLVAILEAVIDHNKPPVKMPELKKAQGARISIALLCGVLIISYFLPWASVNVGITGNNTQLTQQSLFGLIEWLSKAAGIADFFGISGGSTVVSWLYTILALLIILAMITMMMCFVDSRNAYRWLASFFLPLLSIIPAVLLLVATQSANFYIGNIAPGVGAILLFVVCILIWLIAIIDIIVHTNECKWLILFYLSFPIMLLVAVLIIQPLELDDFAFILILALTTILEYFIAKLWKREETTVPTFPKTSEPSKPQPQAIANSGHSYITLPSGNVAYKDKPSLKSDYAPSALRDNANKEAHASVQSVNKFSASNRLSNRMRGYAPVQSKPQSNQESESESES